MPDLMFWRRETVWSLSFVGAGYLRRSVPSTRGPEWTNQWCSSCSARGIEQRRFVAVIKTNDAYIRFAFLTGVTKFSVFSGTNNIEDISLTPEFATICGYTQRDLETV